MATAAYGRDALAELAAVVVDDLGCEAVVGGSVDGILAGEGWAADRPAVALLAFAGTDAVALQADALAGAEDRAGAAFASALVEPPGANDLLIVFADAYSLAARPLLAGFGRSLPGLAVVGVGASEPSGAAPLVWCGAELSSGACSALLIRGTAPAEIGVTHACRALGPPMVVTRSRHHWVRSLDEQPALERFRALGDPGACDGAPRFVGLLEPGAESGPLAPPLIRNVVGWDEASGSFALPEDVPVGTRLVALALDAEAAGRELARCLGEVAAGSPTRTAPACGLYLACRAAGDPLLEAAASSHDLARALGAAPLFGVSSAYQVAPSPLTERPPRLHTYSGVIALVR